ncbi:MAG: glycosyltransferase family 4 protein [Prevotellaceae bacterium]|nr:glycosyltransferase family 4 protein [Prevotellaceae bacterium]
MIPNGIDTSRLEEGRNRRHEPFAFLAFGGRNIDKRVDIIFKAGEMLEQKGSRFTLTVVEGSDTMAVAMNHFGGRLPQWLHFTKPMENINALFAEADCFVSSSVHETFSYAVAEASVYGLPVVQSNIEGTMWNAGNPSAFLFESGDAGDLAGTMEKVMAIPEDVLRNMCSTTRDNNLKQYSLEAWCDKIVDFYEKIPQ